MTDQEFRQISNPNSGEFILAQLGRFGSDAHAKHEISFWLYFDEREQADRAAARIRQTGLRTEISKAASDESWLCLVFCPHIPDEQILDGVIRLLGEVTEQFNGVFDGWESSLEGDDLSLPEGAVDVPPEP
jgi:regulator of RNase E activity RraB